MLSGVGPTSQRAFTFEALIGAPRLLAPAGALLAQVEAQLTDPAGPAGFVLLFDSTAAPVAGDVPIWAEHVGSVAGGAFAADPTRAEYQPGALGRPVTLGLWAAFSSTANVYTALAGNTFEATTEAALP